MTALIKPVVLVVYADKARHMMVEAALGDLGVDAKQG